MHPAPRRHPERTFEAPGVPRALPQRPRAGHPSGQPHSTRKVGKEMFLCEQGANTNFSLTACRFGGLGLKSS